MALFLLGVGMVASICVASSAAEPTLSSVQELYQKQRYKEAAEQALALLHSRDDAESGELMGLYLDCRKELAEPISEADSFVEDQLTRHPNNPSVFRASAAYYSSASPYFYQDHGKFVRTADPRKREYEGSQRDLIRAHQLLLRAGELTRMQQNEILRSQVLIDQALLFIQVGRFEREETTYARLMNLTGLENLPSYVSMNRSDRKEMEIHAWRSNVFVGDTLPLVKATDGTETVLFYQEPESWAAAVNDGERFRWLLHEAVRLNPQLANTVRINTALWQRLFFSYNNVRRFQGRVHDQLYPGAVNGIDPATLADDETVVSFGFLPEGDNDGAEGADSGLPIERKRDLRRISLPPAYNFIGLAKQVELLPIPEEIENYMNAVNLIADEYCARNQRPKAVQAYRKAIRDFQGLAKDPHLEQEKEMRETVGRAIEVLTKNVERLVGSQFGFPKSTATRIAGKAVTIPFQYRNADHVSVTVTPVDMLGLQRDMMKSLDGSSYGQAARPLPGREELLDLLVRQISPFDKYLQRSKAVTSSVDLDPGVSHEDKEMELPVAIRQAGWYLITADDGNGKQVSQLIALNDMLLSYESTPQGGMWLLSDAVSGAPIQDAQLRIYRYDTIRRKDGKGGSFLTHHVTEGRTDSFGRMIESAPVPLHEKTRVSHENLIVVTHGDRYLIFSGRVGVSAPYSSKKTADMREGCMVLSSQPLYRPGQTAQLRGILYRPNFENPSTLPCSGRKLVIKISDPIGNGSLYPVQEVTTDETGGFLLELPIPEEAVNGMYTAQIDVYDQKQELLNKFYHQDLFRVEAYKKPEFKVNVETSRKPIALGDDICVNVRADYYAGGPVNKGTAVVTVTKTLNPMLRSSYRRWYGSYGRYDVFSREDASRLVKEETLPLDQNGKVSLRFSTKEDKKDHPNGTFRYDIKVRVQDDSLRQISASRSVVASGVAFRIDAYPEKNFATVNEPFTCRFTAVGLNGEPLVRGKGECRLYRLSADGKRVLKATYPIHCDDQGKDAISVLTEESGQYEMVCALQDADGHQVTTTQPFFSVGGTTGDMPAFKKALTLTAEKDDYSCSESAKFLLGTNETDLYVRLIFRKGWPDETSQLLYVKDRLTLIDCPLKKSDMPNMNLNALLVRDGETYTAQKEVYLPPVQYLLQVDLSTDKGCYGPQDKGKLKIRVSDVSGKPVCKAYVTVAVYDLSLDYFASEPCPDFAKNLWKALNQTPGFALRDCDSKNIFRFFRPEDPQPLCLLGSEEESVRNFSGRGFNLVRESYDGVMPCMVRSSAPADKSEMASDQDSDEGGDSVSHEFMLRRDFADKILWQGVVLTDERGDVELPMHFPDNLTTWKAVAWAINTSMQAGQSKLEFQTAQPFRISLQMPRFLVENDRVILSALVHNQTDREQTAEVCIGLPPNLLKLINPHESGIRIDRVVADQAATTVSIPPKGQVTVNWAVQALGEGEASLRVYAKTREGLHDAMEQKLPIRVHGMPLVITKSCLLRRGEQECTMSFSLPDKRRPDEGKLCVRVLPNPVLGMLEALPWLEHYPYGCVEQTLNRFVPAFIVMETMSRLGINPERALSDMKTSAKDGSEADGYAMRNRLPQYEVKKLEEMKSVGVERLKQMQHDDGSWSWFSSSYYEGDPVMTSYIVHGLGQLKQDDKMATMLKKGILWLKQEQSKQLVLLNNGVKFEEELRKGVSEGQRSADGKIGSRKSKADPTDVLVALVLSEHGEGSSEMIDYLFRDRSELPILSKIQLAELLFSAKRMSEFEELMPVIEQYIRRNSEQQTAWLQLPEFQSGRWFVNRVSVQAAFLKLLTKTAPESEITTELARWILSNRAHGSYWDSTKDTADCLEALSAYLLLSGREAETMEMEVLYDGKMVKTIRCDQSDLFTFDSVWELPCREIGDGPHTVTLRRKSGNGNPVGSLVLQTFTLEEQIPPEGSAVMVSRSFYRVDTLTDDQGIMSKERTLLKDGDVVNSGDIIESDIDVSITNDVDYLMLRDPKPAGFESTSLLSGYVDAPGFPYKEINDEEILMFIRHLPMGSYRYTHTLRAERPGIFCAMPASAGAMYVPELTGNSTNSELSVSQEK